MAYTLAGFLYPYAKGTLYVGAIIPLPGTVRDHQLWMERFLVDSILPAHLRIIRSVQPACQRYFRPGQALP